MRLLVMPRRITLICALQNFNSKQWIKQDTPNVKIGDCAPEVFIMKHYTAKDIRVLSSLYRLPTSKCKLIFEMADDKFHAEQLAKLYYNGKTIEEIIAMLIYETRERIDRPYIPKEKWGK